jgi:hypothetical protein
MDGSTQADHTRDERDSFGGWTGMRRRATGFFRVECVDGRWWLVDPLGHPFLSIGLNHIASDAMRTPENLGLFRRRYGDEETWIREGVVRDLRDWGFNTIGWTQENCVRYEPSDPRKRAKPHHPRRRWGRRTALWHDRMWERERYDWAGMPYCHNLNFMMNAFYWDGSPWVSDYTPQYPDVFSDFFEDWCDWVARHFCTTMADDPNLIGYFYSDTPDWLGDVHSNAWVSPEEAVTPGGRERLAAIARRYYEVTHAAVRRYDRHHLILGDRHLGNAGVPDVVLAGMAGTVDVLSIQYGGNFRAERPRLAAWHAATGLPLLMADAVMPPQYYDPPRQRRRGDAYRRYVADALASDFVVGIHFCGAYLENTARGWGVKSARDREYAGITNAFRRVHPQVYRGAFRADQPGAATSP